MSEPNPVSALWWLPRIEGGLLPSPETVVVLYDHERLMGYWDSTDQFPREFAEGDDELKRVSALVLKAMKQTGIPSFLRSDLASAKHDGPRHYKIEVPTDAERVVAATFEDNELKFGIGGITPRAFLVRRWLDIEHGFKAFGGHPIGREWRFFAAANGVRCCHYYWPETAILNADREDWKACRNREAGIPPPPELEGWALVAAGLMGDVVPEWSVDFAQDTAGAWWLIDMAPAAGSWHPDHETGDIP